MEVNKDFDDNLQVWHDPKLKPPKPFKTKIIRTPNEINTSNKSDITPEMDSLSK